MQTRTQLWLLRTIFTSIRLQACRWAINCLARFMLHQFSSLNETGGLYAMWVRHIPHHANADATLQNYINIFYLTWIISLHYTLIMKLKMLIPHVQPLSCQREKLQKLFYLNCRLQCRKIWIHLITPCGENCKRRFRKHTLLIWTYWRCH